MNMGYRGGKLDFFWLILGLRLWPKDRSDSGVGFSVNQGRPL